MIKQWEQIIYLHSTNSEDDNTKLSQTQITKYAKNKHQLKELINNQLKP